MIRTEEKERKIEKGGRKEGRKKNMRRYAGY